MKICRDKIHKNISSNKSSEELRFELQQLVKTSKIFNNKSNSNTDFLYLVSKIKIRYIRPHTAKYRITIKFINSGQDLNQIAQIVIKGNRVLSDFKYFALFLLILFELFFYLTNSNTDINPILSYYRYILNFTALLIFSIVFQWLNFGYIEEGVEDFKQLLNNKDYVLNDK